MPELSTNPDYIHAAGLERLIEEWGGEFIRPVQDIRLTEDQEKQYGPWNRMALANSNIADVVREGLQDGLLTIGLEANCNDLLGMLAGLKYDSDGNARRVGLVFIDSYGDFNVPETTLSGMLGGMPVAVAAGHALHNLRLQNDKVAGKLIPTADASAIFAEYASALRAGLSAMPGRLSSQLGGMSRPAAIGKLLQDEIDEFLTSAEAALTKLTSEDPATGDNQHGDLH